MAKVKRFKAKGKRIFVLDTNVLMHDPTSLFRFSEHDIYLPMVVLEELDSVKKGMSEVSRNVRQVTRFIDDLISNTPNHELQKGISLAKSSYNNLFEGQGCGKLYFQTEEIFAELPSSLPGQKVDNTILAVTMALQDDNPKTPITLISKDINLRIKASIVGLHTEDYFNDLVLDDVNLLYAGVSELHENFWQDHVKEMDSWKEEGKTFYKLTGPATNQWYPNQFLNNEAEDFRAVVRSKPQKNEAIIEITKDYTNKNNNVWGITARNNEQNFALNMLMDPEIDFITLLGAAGTGKTLLALAAALEQTIEQKIYREIIVTRVTVPLGEDIGFLPGTEEEKMTPWMGAFVDNLEVLAYGEHEDSWEKSATEDLLKKYIKVRSLAFMRGRTFLNRILIVDEAQNLTPKQMKALITRAGPGTKMICLGNIAQIDTPYLTETSSGLTYVVDHFKEWAYSGHITLKTGERSRLAHYASEVL